MSSSPDGLKLTKEQDRLLRAALVDMAGKLRPVTVRGLYYQCVLAASLPFITKDSGKKRNYTFVQSRSLDLREQGLIPWQWIVDESRDASGLDRWTGPAGFADTAPRYYRLDLWVEQSIRPFVLVEKVGQMGVYRAHADRFGVDVVACKGYSSASQLWAVAQGIIPFLEVGQDIRFLICADFDPSGWDWPRAAQVEVCQHLLRRLGHGEVVDKASKADLACPKAAGEFLALSSSLLTKAGWGGLSFHRELVTTADLKRLGPAVALRAPNPDDTRTKRFLAAHGWSAEQEVCVEMDAIAPTEARARLQARYEELFDGDISGRRELEDQHRAAITAALSALQE